MLNAEREPRLSRDTESRRARSSIGKASVPPAVFPNPPATSTPAAPTIASVVKRFSRDEMNLAEFPLAVLSTRHDSDVKTLEFSDSLTGKNGERIERKWVITGADKFGLPTASDDEVLLGLLRLSATQEFRDRKVTFTRYELLRILKWSTEGRSYGRLQRALDRLSGVRIKTSNGFYDNSSKSHQTRNFGIIDAYELNDGRGDRDALEEKAHGSARTHSETTVKPSFFVWSEAMFTSFQSGFIKKLDLDFLLGLKSAVSKRLYRFLDKHFWYRSKVQYNLFTLAHEKIGISRNYAYASQLKQQLQPAIEELMENGFLQGCEYVGKGNDTEIILVAGVGNRQAPAIGTRAATTSVQAHAAPTPASGSQDGELSIVEALEQRGLAKPQALRLVGLLDQKQLQRAWAIIKHFDELMASNSTRVNKNPAGFLYRAIERADSFVLPGEMRDKAFAKPSASAASGAGSRLNQQKLQAKLKEQVSSESVTHSLLKAQRASLKHQVEPQMLDRIRTEVTKSLEKLRGLISEARFHDTVEHAVEERLAKLFAV